MRLNHVTLPATDMAASIAFYRKLGLKLIVDGEAYARLVAPENEATLSLMVTDARPSDATTDICFECDVDAEHARLIAAGVVFDSGPEDKRWLWREAHLRDPAGNRIILFSAGENRLNPPWRVQD